MSCWVSRVILLGWVASPVGAIAVEMVLLSKLVFCAFSRVILPALPWPAVTADISEVFKFKLDVFKVIC